MNTMNTLYSYLWPTTSTTAPSQNLDVGQGMEEAREYLVEDFDFKVNGIELDLQSLQGLLQALTSLQQESKYIFDPLALKQVRLLC